MRSYDDRWALYNRYAAYDQGAVLLALQEVVAVR